MNRPLSRRGLFGALGTVSVATLLGACSPNGTTTSATVPTTGGGTASLQPSTSSSSGAVALLDQASTCTLAPETTQGPYYFDVDSIRSDIREDRQGTELRLALRVQTSAHCAPLSNAVVSIWHCDALGLYSGFENQSTGGGGRGGPPPGDAPAAAGGSVPPPEGPPPAREGVAGGSGETTPTDDERYLRGAQVTNADGIVEFVTIYPGWYTGRAVHLHLKVFIDNRIEATTQLFFDESFTDTVYRDSPYSTHPGRDTRVDNDNIYTHADRAGTPILVTLAHDGTAVLGAANIVINPG